MEFRTKCITGLFKDLYSTVKEANKDIDFRYNTYLRQPELAGLSFRAVRDYLETNIKGWPGTAGVFELSPEDHYGLTEESFTWFKVKDGTFVPFPGEEW